MSTVVPRFAWRGMLLGPMPVVICLLRGVNVTGNNLIKMEALRELCGRVPHPSRVCLDGDFPMHRRNRRARVYNRCRRNR